MSTDRKRYSISVNKSIVDKPAQSERAGFGAGFEPVEVTIDEFMNHIQSGHAYAPQFKNGRRKATHFSRAGFLAADVDGGMTIEETKEHALVRHHAGLIHTTASHTPQSHRFRIIVLLDEAIQVAPDWADAQLGLAVTLDSDRSVSDAARMFFGNTKAVFFKISRSMPPSIVADLIARGRDARAQTAGIKGRLPVDSAKQIGPGALIKLAGGDQCRMDELSVGASVHCPYHDDTNASAFVTRSKAGAPVIHCSACKVTFWPDNKRDEYDFEAFEKLVEQRRLSEAPTNDDAVGLERFFPPKPKLVKLNQPFLPPIDYAPGITMVKSWKGSGKTASLEVMILKIRSGMMAGIDAKDRPKRILLVGHRRTLIREAAEKLSLRCYLDPDDGDPDGLLTLAVCLDSLPKFGESFAADRGVSGWRRRGPFDLVIIDEVEQVLKHLRSDTIEQKAGLERCYDALAYEVTHAKAVVVLDADLGLLTAHAMRLWRPRDWESRCRIIYNEPVTSAARRTMRLFKDRKRLEREVIDAIRSGQRCFITSNSKNFVNVMERMIRKECGEDVVMRVVTGDNSQEDAVINFVKNIRTDFLRVQVVLVTPSMGTGVDITFPNGACHVDRVFGFFYSMINAHTDIDQQLCRVRNPGAVDVWIDGATYNYTCNVEIVKDDLARAYTVKRAVRGKRPDGMVDYERDDPLLMLCAHVTALERASKNRLVELFCKMREANGWDIQRVGEKDRDSAYDDARDELRQERAERLLGAPRLNQSDFIDLDMQVSARANLSLEERAAYEKHVFESDVGVELDADIVALNVDGRLKQRIATLAEMVSFWDRPQFDVTEALIEPTTEAEGRLQKMTAPWMLGVLMRIAGLTTASGLKSELLLSTGDLSEFVSVCRINRTVIEEIFSEALRSDLEQKPVRQLNRFLARIGFSLNVTRSLKRSGEKVRYYALDLDMVNQMLRLARSYLVVQERKETEREMAGGKMRAGPGQDPQQGTKENSPYIATNTGLLSLLPPKTGG
ncbi:plasmid replication protein, CyRepA1 family [Bradyrhizobium sp. LTSP857]|uniref:plasmid replication protein, CyRepA1 family n=1 Tax=Bradyrhizobium sp. LTSP857 TaxID=1619231 RepID=UPI0005D21757|nr:plasmid replication protein, CyRepA1 family [Bradyrhizobium sp. LTSP857]KJC44549.1 hypothetical protein UP06_18985 [Bradyrhizobium sp. LTSP857]